MKSRFTIGDIVLFQPNIEKIDFKTMTTSDTSAVKAKVVQVQFALDKVLYDLALANDGSFYEIYPIRSVDSVFVCPVIEETETLHCCKVNIDLIREIYDKPESEKEKKCHSFDKDLICCKNSEKLLDEFPLGTVFHEA